MSRRTSTQLLCYHDHKCGQCRASHTGNDKKLLKPSQVSTPVTEMFFTAFNIYLLDISISKHDLLKSYLRVYVVKVASGLKGSVSEALERLKCIVV